MADPKADPPRCDVPGCGAVAVNCTDGSEEDAQKDLGRPALPNINHCAHHHNWPHSNDAQVFAQTETYRKRK